MKTYCNLCAKESKDSEANVLYAEGLYMICKECKDKAEAERQKMKPLLLVIKEDK